MAKALRPIGHEDRLSIVDHLDELRSRLFVCLAVLAVAFGLCYWQNSHLLDLLNKPLPANTKTASNKIGGLTRANVGASKAIGDAAKQFRALSGSSDLSAGDRSVIAYGDDENVTLAAKEYVRLRDQKSALEDEMEFWSAAVGRPAKGQYGDLTITYSKDGSQVDPAAAAKLLNEMGVSVPMRPVAGRRYVRRAERR